MLVISEWLLKDPSKIRHQVFILKSFQKIKRFEGWETMDIFPYHVFKKIKTSKFELNYTQ